MDDEMRAHIEMQTQENIDAGMKPEDARYTALRQFGSVESIKETCREQRGVRWIEDLGQDIRYGARILRKNPGFTTVAILTLALGIGANTAIFSLVDAVLLKSLPVHQPERLFFVTSGDNAQVCYPLIDRFQKLTSDVGEAFAYRPMKWRIKARDGNDVVVGQLVSGNYFPALKVTMSLGRAIDSSDDRPEASPVTVISFGCWERQFGRDPTVAGKALMLNGVPFTIVGVAPPEFHGLDPQAVPEAFVPVRHHALLTPGDSRLLSEYGNWVFSALIRLNPGVAEEAARGRLSTVYQQLVSESAAEWIRAKDLPEFLKRGVQLAPAARGVAKLREKFSRPLLVLMGASVLVFLIACANVTNLLLARSAVRGREMALRLALGAGRSRMMRLLLAESLLLAGLGSALGLALAVLSSKGLVRFLPQEAVGIISDISLNGRLLGFSIAASFAATILVGFGPAHRGSRVALSAVLNNGGRITGGTISRLSGWLVVSQVALSLVLLIGAGLFVRTLRELARFDPGFQRENILLLTVQPDLTGYRDADVDKLNARLTSAELLERLEALPGVKSASLSSAPPFGDRPWWRIPIKPADATTRTEDRIGAAMRWVTPKYFETLGIPILRGRPLTGGDSAKAPKVAVISETMSRQYYGGAEPLGQRFKLTSGLETLGEIEIVGVVRDTREVTLREKGSPIFYLPFAQFGNADNLVFALRHFGNSQSVAIAARREIESVDASLALTKVSRLSEVVNASVVQDRAIATLSSGFGALALLLAAVGLYGVLAYTVTQRTREIGLRIALGAPRGNVVGLFLSQGMRLAGVGLIIGAACALALTRLLQSQLFGINSTDPLTFITLPLLLAMAAFLACWLPARRAAKVDPMVALRYE